MKKLALLSLSKLLTKYSVVLFCITSLCLSYAGLNAGEMLEARINIGLKLFRAILAADLNIKTKVSCDSRLPLLLIYKNNSSKGIKYQQNLLSLGRKKGIAKIKNIPIDVSYVSYQDFFSKQKNYQQSLSAGIFLLDKFSSEELLFISSYGIKNHLIIYSPFDGDIEKGISAGLAIGARVRPIVNLKVLSKSTIHIKSFFLKVAKKYEP